MSAIEITQIDIDEIRAGFAWIAERVRRGNAGMQPIADTTAAKANRYIEHLEAQVASCSCAKIKDFEIRPTPAPYLAMEQARVDRLLFEVAQ